MLFQNAQLSVSVVRQEKRSESIVYPTAVRISVGSFKSFENIKTKPRPFTAQGTSLDVWLKDRATISTSQ
jgi:hypothetical protein